MAKDNDVEAKAYSDTLSDRLAEVKAEKVGETLTDLKAVSPVLTLAPTLVSAPGVASMGQAVVKTQADTQTKKT